MSETDASIERGAGLFRGRSALGLRTKAITDGDVEPAAAAARHRRAQIGSGRAAGFRPIVTVEIDLKRNAIVQARGYHDRPASRAELSILRTWAWREHLRMGI